MSSERKKEESIFDKAIRIKSATKRAGFVKSACGDDSELLGRVEALLRVHYEDKSFLEVPPVTLDDSPLTEGPGTRIGRYKLLQQIGEGGFGVVYMAEQEKPIRRRVALKIIKLGMDTKQVIARFEAERQALALMEHPNIAKVLDAGATDTGRPYFVMELVKGVPITKYCDSNNLSTKERLKLFIDVCKAVQHAHQKGIIHRDIKPTNVMITLRDDGTGVPKIIDFGIAKATQHRLTEKTFFTEFKQFIGTPEYMSPEQSQMGEVDVDTRSDIYSLGVLLYELLTGTTPFDAEELRSAAYDEMLKIIRETDPPKPSTRLNTLDDVLSEVARHRHIGPGQLCKIVRGDLDWVVMKTLEKDRTRRYETANELSRDIERYMNDEPVMAGPPSTVYRIKKFVRRNRTAVAVVLLIALALVIGLCLATVGFVQASHQRNRAVTAEIEAVTQRDTAEQAHEKEAAARTKAEQAKNIAQEQRQRSERLLARAQLERGVKLLNEGNGLGLLDLLEAWNNTKEMPGLRDAIGRLWVISHKLLAGRLVHVMSYADVLSFSPDGRLIAGAYETTAQIWNMETGQPHSPLLQLEKTIGAVVFSPDGRLLATHSVEGVSRLWNPATGQAVGPTLRHDGGSRKSSEPVWGLAEAYWSATFSPDGKLLATASLNGTVQLWKTGTGQPYGKPLAHEGQVWAVAFSPDGRLLASGSANKTVQLWDVASGRSQGPPLQHEERIRGIIFSPDGKLLATGAGGPIYLWKTETGQLHAKLEHQRWVEDMTFSPDGNLMATASADWTVQLWDLTTGKTHGQELQHDGAVRAVSFSPNGKLLATTSRDRTTRIWEVASGKPYGPQLYCRWAGRKVVFSPDGKLLASPGTRIWSTDLQLHTEVVPDRKRVQPNVISPDGKVRAIISGNEVQLWDVAEDKELGEGLYHEGEVHTVRFSPDGKLLAAGTGMWPRESTLRLWDVATRKLVWPPMKITDCYTLVFSPDGKLLVSGSAGHRAWVFDVATGSLLHELICDEHVPTVAFSPDGKILATGSSGGTVEQWDMATGHRVAPMIQHRLPVEAVAYNPDGNLLATISSGIEARTVRIWALDSGPPYQGLSMPPQLISGEGELESFSSDGTLLVSRNADRTKRVWRLPATPTELREMQLQTWIALGAQRDQNGEVVSIPWEQWQKLREELHSSFMAE